jgi:hypothetical protein
MAALSIEIGDTHVSNNKYVSLSAPVSLSLSLSLLPAHFKNGSEFFEFFPPFFCHLAIDFQELIFSRFSFVQSCKKF